MASMSYVQQEAEFLQGMSQNLPDVDFNMFLTYIEDHKCSNRTKSQEESVDKGANRPNYSNIVVTYVQLRRNKDLCTITTEMSSRENEMFYIVIIKIDEKNGDIVNASCAACACDTGCIHIAALLKWLHLQTEDRSRKEDKEQMQLPSYDEKTKESEYLVDNLSEKLEDLTSASDLSEESASSSSTDFCSSEDEKDRYSVRNLLGSLFNKDEDKHFYLRRLFKEKEDKELKHFYLRRLFKEKEDKELKHFYLTRLFNEKKDEEDESFYLKMFNDEDEEDFDEIFRGSRFHFKQQKKRAEEFEELLKTYNLLKKKPSDDDYVEISPEMASCSLHLLKFSYRGDKNNAEEFLQYTSRILQSETCEEIDDETEFRCFNRLWREFRYGRLIPSDVYEAAYHGIQVLSPIYINATKFRIEDSAEARAIESNRQLRDVALQFVEAYSAETIKKCGIILNKEYPIFITAPDGLGADCVVQIVSHKLPYGPSWNVTQSQAAAIQMQMLMCQRNFGYFCMIGSEFEQTKTVKIIEVSLDLDYILPIMIDAFSNWKKYIFPHLMTLL